MQVYVDVKWNSFEPCTHLRTNDRIASGSYSCSCPFLNNIFICQHMAFLANANTSQNSDINFITPIST